MSSSARCSSEATALAALVLTLLLGCSHAPRSREPRFAGDGERPLRVAMFPPHDLSGVSLHELPLSAALEEAFARAGLEILSEGTTESSLGTRRFRWVGGVDSDAAQALREDLGVEAVVLTAIEAYAPGPPPLISISARLVSLEGEPRILWAGSFSRTGDDSRGLLGIGAITDPAKLQRRAASELGRSLSRYLRRAPDRGSRCAPDAAFAPRFVHRIPFGSGGRLKVAVLPFLNRTNRENAGEVLGLVFLNQLSAAERFEVIDPGVVRSVLLRRRIVIRGGVSFDEATTLLDTLGADLVLSGEVRDFEQHGGKHGVPRVEFTARFLDRDGNVVWQSLSQNAGTDDVSVFDAGAVRTASGLACRMSAAIVAELAALEQDAAIVQERSMSSQGPSSRAESSSDGARLLDAMLAGRVARAPAGLRPRPLRRKRCARRRQHPRIRHPGFQGKTQGCAARPLQPRRVCD